MFEILIQLLLIYFFFYKFDWFLVSFTIVSLQFYCGPLYLIHRHPDTKKSIVSTAETVFAASNQIINKLL